MPEIKLQSGKFKVVSNGTVFSRNGETVSISIMDYYPKHNVRVDAHIFVEFTSHAAEDLVRIDIGEVLPKQHSTHHSSVFNVKVANIKEGRYLGQDDITCATFPGGYFKMNLYAFSLVPSRLQGVTYTIFEVLTD